MPDIAPSRRLRLKFAAIGAIGTAMVLLPLGQVLRYQNADLQAIVAERTTLDPMAHALAVQRSLLGHRDVAHRVLQGRLQLEAERHLRKVAVDESLWLLQGTLSAGYWVKALGESNALAQDWRRLAGRVAQRDVQPAENLAAHQLLVEQAVQVMDLVSAAAPAGSYAQLAAAANHGALRHAEVAVLESAVQAHTRHLAGRTAALQARQSALALAWGLLATAALLAGATVARALRATPPGAANPAADSDDVRRGRGRRATDGAAPAARSGADTSSQLLQRLRGADAPDSAHAADADGPAPPRSP